MKPYIIYHVFRADFLERTRRFSFMALCAAVMFLTFFSVPDVKAPFVSVCLEPYIFRQGSNATWIPITISLCGGILFPIVGFGFVKGNISMDRNSGFLYTCQSMNMKNSSYIVGKFLSNLLMLTIMWFVAIVSAAVMLVSKFPSHMPGFYEYISPFMGIYPGIVFAAVFAVILESLPIHDRFKNAAGITTLFIMFLISYSTSDYSSPLIRIVDYSNYRWNVESINSVVNPVIGHDVWETGILVPGGMFSESDGTKEIFFHGLLWDSSYFADKIFLVAICLILVAVAVMTLEQAEREKKNKAEQSREQMRFAHSHYLSHFMFELKMLFKGFPKAVFILIGGLWVYSFFAPLQYVQGYVWVITLIFAMPVFSQIGCREHEYNMAEYFMTIQYSLVKQALYSYLWGVFVLLMISIPVVLKLIWLHEYFSAFCYVVFSLFIPAAASFLGEYSKTRRAFETLFLLLCFLLINLPSFLLNGYAVVIMGTGMVTFLLAVFGKKVKA